MTGGRQAALRRLLVIVVFWAATEALLRVAGMHELATAAGLGAAIAAFFLTRDAGAAPRKRGEVVYWRGRRIDKNDLN